MNRRSFGKLAVGLWLSRGAVAADKIWRIGFLSATSRESMVERGSYPAFLDGMKAAGYVEGKNLLIEWRDANGAYDRLPALAAELVRIPVDLIVAAPSPAIRAAQQATSTIPIVFPTTGDPVGSGFAASLARPGGNLTGISNGDLEVSAKTLQLLSSLVPGLSKIALVVNPGSLTAPGITKNVQAAAQRMGMQISVLPVGSAAQMDEAFSQMKRQRVEAFVVGADAWLNTEAPAIARRAIELRLPSISQGRSYAVRGGLLCYGTDGRDGYRRAAAYVDKILKGARPGDLPIEEPTQISLVINLKTARELGIVIPQSLLVQAAELIR